MRALVVHTGGGLGDVLLSGPVVDTLSAAGFTVDFLARSGTVEAIRHHELVNEILTIDSKDPSDLSAMKTWAAKLRSRAYDICLLLWSTSRWAWTLYYSGIPRRVGQDSRLLYSFLFTDKVAIRSERGDTTTHWTEILLDYTRTAGFNPVPPKVNYMVPQEALSDADKHLGQFDFGQQTGPLIGFHSGKGLPLTPGRWPVQHFAILARELQETLNARLVLTGGPSEVEIVKSISDSLPLPHLNLAGATSLPVLAGVAKRCQLFVCPDSGPMHLAAAVKTPVVGIYALDEDFPERWAPFDVPHRVIRPPRPACPPGCKKPTCSNFACYLKVSPESIVQACSELLEEVGANETRS